MSFLLEKIDLVREKQAFQASVAIVKGGLPVLSRYFEMLHPEEKRIYNNYKYDRRKASYLLGRLAAKAAILDLTGTDHANSIWIDSGVFQFPVVKSPGIQNIQVSISHYENIGLSIAFPEEHPMGIDVEKVEADKEELVLGQMTESEKKLLQQAGRNDVAGYFSIFSIKESLSKVIKTGMMMDFKFFEINQIEVNGQVMEVTFTNFGQYKATAFHKNNFVFSFALPRKTKVDFTAVYRMIELNC